MWKTGLVRCGLGLAVGVIMATAAMAADGDDLAARLRACRTTPDITTRAFCYDRIVDTLGAPSVTAPRAAVPATPATPAAQPAAPVAPAAPVTPEARFGEKDLAVKKRIAENELPPDELVLKVTSVRTDQAGYSTFTLENGQVWRQVEASSLRVSNGARVKIKSGTLGVYYLSLDGSNKSFRVKRVQ